MRGPVLTARPIGLRLAQSRKARPAAILAKPFTHSRACSTESSACKQIAANDPCEVALCREDEAVRAEATRCLGQAGAAAARLQADAQQARAAAATLVEQAAALDAARAAQEAAAAAAQVRTSFA